MNTITTTDIAAINKHHQLACDSADQAISHAMEAGKLLLKAKASMPHGAWLAWLATHVSVSARQSRRYMQVAAGKPLPIRAPAPKVEAKRTHAANLPTDTRPTGKYLIDMADLPNTDILPLKPGFQAIPDHVMTASKDGRHFVIEQSTEAGFYYVSCIALRGDDDATMDYLSKPIRGDYVDAPLKAWGIADPAELDWSSMRMDRPAKAALELVVEAA
jgi:hypothetical protein